MNANLKEKLKAGEVVHGCWINLGSTVSAEIMGSIGFDWLLIDLEHGPGNDQIMFQQLQALSGSKATPIVRIAELARPRVQRILDAGAQGVMFPQIQNQEEAKLASESMYYPPRGIRGMAKGVRATDFGKNFTTYVSSLDMFLTCIVQIETKVGLENVESIAQVKDVDILFLGPTDLSVSLGIPGQFDHPEFQKAVIRIADVSKKYGKTAGVLLQSIQEYDMYYEKGFRFIAAGGESAFIQDGGTETLKYLKSRSKK